MRATITQILPRKWGNGTDYYRVKFKGEDGEFYITDLCPAFRNWSRWKNLMETGNEIGNLSIMHPGKINADSAPVLVSKPGPNPQMELF